MSLWFVGYICHASGDASQSMRFSPVGDFLIGVSCWCLCNSEELSARWMHQLSSQSLVFVRMRFGRCCKSCVAQASVTKFEAQGLVTPVAMYWNVARAGGWGGCLTETSKHPEHPVGIKEARLGPKEARLGPPEQDDPWDLIRHEKWETRTGPQTATSPPRQPSALKADETPKPLKRTKTNMSCWPIHKRAAHNPKCTPAIGEGMFKPRESAPTQTETQKCALGPSKST